MIRSITKYAIDSGFWLVEGHFTREWVGLGVFHSEEEAQNFIDENYPGVEQE